MGAIQPVSRLEELKMKVVFNVTTWCCSPTIKCGEQLVEALIAEAQRDALEKAVRIAKDYGDEVDTFEEERTAKYIADRIRALLPSEVNND